MINPFIYASRPRNGTLSSGVARTPKSYAHLRETTGSNSDSLQLRPFLKWELILKERICSQRERILSFKSIFNGMENHSYRIW